jgi:uncharacterized protein YcbK (DUF882 family)
MSRMLNLYDAKARLSSLVEEAAAGADLYGRRLRRAPAGGAARGICGQGWMILLLDTHVVLWWQRDDRRLNRAARQAILRAGAPGNGRVPAQVHRHPGRRAAGARRALRFFHTHTSGRLAVEYFSGGHYQPDALATVNHFLRDAPVRRDFRISLAADQSRAPAAQRGSGCRQPPYEGLGDRHPPAGVPLTKLRATALTLRGGGVGYYPASDFVHVDTGRVRFW